MLEHASLLGLSLVRVPLEKGKLNFPCSAATPCIVRGTSVGGREGAIGRIEIGHVEEGRLGRTIETADDSHYRTKSFLLGARWL